MVDFLNWLFDINGVSILYLLERNRVGEGIASYGEATREARLWIERQNARKSNGNKEQTLSPPHWRSIWNYASRSAFLGACMLIFQ